MVVRTVFTRVFTLGSHVRSRLYFTSADEKGSPLCHLTPGRSLNVHVVDGDSFHSVASPGWSLPSGRRLTRLSNRLNEIRMSFDEVEKWGSNFEMSPPWATTSSRFWVVCAPAMLGARAPATPSAPAPWSSSRRVMCVMHASSVVLRRWQRYRPRSRPLSRTVGISD